jgi:antitoxin CptB
MMEAYQPMQETREIRIKRMRLRSWRRGTKEMDLILGQFADDCLAGLSDAELDAHEALMAEHDLDLYRWISGQLPSPEPLAKALARVRHHFLQKITRH